MTKVAAIRAVPIPDDLSDIEKAECQAFQEALSEIEADVIRLRNGQNIDQHTAHQLLEELRTQGHEQAEENFRLRLEIIEEQVRTERNRIESEFEEAQRALHQSILRTYCQIDVALNAQLKELMGKNYGAYIANNSIEFPRMPPETQMRTRLHEPEEAKIRISQAEAEKDLRRIQQKYGQLHEPI
jgi:GTPase SAR1 family protein